MSADLSTPIRGVLFDIDDTLIDLANAATTTFLALSAIHLTDVPRDERARVAELFAADTWGYYEQYMAGELDFLGQRVKRVQRAFAEAGGPVLTHAQLEKLSTAYEEAMRDAWEPFGDVHPCLDLLDDLGIPYGAVSNNVETYQRMKLDAAGLERVTVLVGSDTAGAPKPDPRPFLAGAEHLGTPPGQTAYVGDNPVNDVQGAREAGLVPILLDRTFDGFACAGAETDGHTVPNHVISTLSQLRDIIVAITGEARFWNSPVARVK